MTAKLKQYGFSGTVARTHNMDLAKAVGQCICEVLCIYFTLVLGYRLVLINARLRLAPIL